jgi:hypothetical protein
MLPRSEPLITVSHSTERGTTVIVTTDTNGDTTMVLLTPKETHNDNRSK